MRKRLDELKLTGTLPSPTGVGLLILQLTQGDDYAIGEITRVIQSDPALSGRILKLANSSLRGGYEPARAVNEAAMRLGVRTVRNLALGFTLVNGHRSGACQGFDYDTYWSHSLASAVAAQKLAERLGQAAPAEAFTCGLLSGIGRLALASIHPDSYASVLERARRERLDLVQCELEAFDVDHRELGAALLDDWKLPAHFGFAVSAFDAPGGIADAPDEASRLMTQVLQAAARLARQHLLAPESEDSQGIDALLCEVGLPEGGGTELLAELRASWAEWGGVLAIPTEVHARDVESAARRMVGSEPSLPDPLLQDVPRRKGLRILAVDDDSVSLRLLAHHLTRDGHTVTNAGDGREALLRALQANPQMVITDWMMPEMDGIELCKALRRSNESRGMYILLLTGREDEDRVVEAFDAGADDYVNKPFNAKILLARVRAGQRMIELREQVEADRRERLRQVSQLAVLNRRLEAMAMTDILTRLPNRRYAMERLEQEIASARRSSAPLCVIMLDIDHFKAVNDNHGHDTGDLVLRETAEALRKSLRKGDVPCRLGGEEFIVICPGSDLAGCSLVAERVREAIEQNLIGGGYGKVVTVSLGVATFDPHSSTVDTLLKEADRRVYLAKSLGRNQVCLGDEPEQRRERA